jgi:hypothetical protein
MASILEAEIHALGLLVDLVPFLAGFPNGRGVHQRGQLREVVRQQAVEEVDIVISERAEVQKPLEVCGLQSQLCQTSLLLHLVALCTGRSQAISLQVFANWDGKRGIVVSCPTWDVSGGMAMLRPVGVGSLRAGDGGEVAHALGDGGIQRRGGGHLGRVYELDEF